MSIAMLQLERPPSFFFPGRYPGLINPLQKIAHSAFCIDLFISIGENLKKIV